MSKKISEYGIRRNKHTCKQRYKCKRCGKTFVENDGFLNRKFSPKVITASLDLWNKGVSLRQIKHHLKQFYDVNVNHVTILNWLRDYGRLCKRYVDSLDPDLSGEWMADEMVFYFGKNHNWIWNLMHKHKKFLISSRISYFRHLKHARRIFLDGFARSNGNAPDVIQTDGLNAYPYAIYGVFGDDTKHVRHASLKSKINMNIVERLQGSCRDRLKVTRGFHSVESGQKLWDIWRVYYNFVRDHMSLGETPAEMCGLDLKLSENKWLKLIQKSANFNEIY